MGKQWKQCQTLFLGAPKSLQIVTAAMKLKFLGRKVMTNQGSILKSRDITLPTKVHLVKAMVFPAGGAMPWTEESGSYNPQGHTGSDMPEATEYSHT